MKPTRQTGPAATVALPTPIVDGPLSVEAAVQRRRSCREFADRTLTLAQAGQILWAAQGVTDTERGRRAAPSAGARYPLELAIVAGQVAGLASGLYHYRPAEHTLDLVRSGDQRQALARLAASQLWLADAAIILVICAVFERTMARYGDRGRRYVYLDAGIAVENACLQAEALGLGAVVVGAFDDEAVARLLALPRDPAPLLLLPVGQPGTNADGSV